MDLRAVYRGRRVLVTGDTGFKGSWLVLWLRSLGATVSGIALAPRRPRDNFVACGMSGTYARLDADVRDPAMVESAVWHGKPEIVFHLAAQPLVRAGYADPVGTFATNVMGTVNVLQALRAADTVRAVVVVTSDKCYAAADPMTARREGDPLGGDDPYSASKAAAEIVTHAMRASYYRDGAAIATARAGNVIGGGDWSDDRVIPDCMRAIEEDRPIRLRQPHAIRPWQHVLDALHGYLVLGAQLVERGAAVARAWNFGPPPDKPVTVVELVERLIAAWGSGRHEVDPQTGGKEAAVLELDSSTAIAELGWRPRLDVARAIDWTVEGYRAERLVRDRVRAQRIAQIHAYEELAGG